jgi:hypothetical protein
VAEKARVEAGARTAAVRKVEENILAMYVWGEGLGMTTGGGWWKECIESGWNCGVVCDGGEGARRG